MMDLTTAHGICLLDKLQNEESSMRLYVDEEPKDLTSRLVSAESKLIQELREETKQALLYVDSEEPENLRTKLVSPESGGCTIQKSLPCADYYYCYRTPEDGKEHLMYVVERKALSDLNGGFDGRHKDQLFRLLHLPIPRHHIIYLIEYQDETKIQHYKGIDVLLRELNEIHVKHGISVYWSPGKSFTVLYLLQLLQSVMHSAPEFSKGFHVVEEGKVHLRSYPAVDDLFEFAKRGISKKGNESPELLFLNQLRAIRGMGEAKAKAVARDYPSWAALEALRQEEGDQNAIKKLTKISLDGATKRRLGKVLAGKVIKALTTS